MRQTLLLAWAISISLPSSAFAVTESCLAPLDKILVASEVAQSFAEGSKRGSTNITGDLEAIFQDRVKVRDRLEELHTKTTPEEPTIDPTQFLSAADQKRLNTLAVQLGKQMGRHALKAEKILPEWRRLRESGENPKRVQKLERELVQTETEIQREYERLLAKARKLLSSQQVEQLESAETTQGERLRLAQANSEDNEIIDSLNYLPESTVWRFQKVGHDREVKWGWLDAFFVTVRPDQSVARVFVKSENQSFEVNFEKNCAVSAVNMSPNLKTLCGFKEDIRTCDLKIQTPILCLHKSQAACNAVLNPYIPRFDARCKAIFGLCRVLESLTLPAKQDTPGESTPEQVRSDGA